MAIGGLALLLVIAMAAGTFVVTGALNPQADPTPSGTPQTPSTSPSVTPTPRPTSVDQATPTSRPTPGYRGTGQVDNVLYNASWQRDSGREYCPEVVALEPMRDKPEASLTRIVDCLVRLHSQVLQPYGITIQAPKVKFYRGEISSPCGMIEDSSLGSLCLRDETLYFSLNAAESRTEGYATNKLGYFWIAAHEFAHYVQMRAGIIGAGRNSGDNLTSRRIELQANCMSGMVLGAVWSQIGGTANSHLGMHRFFRDIYGDQAPGQGTHGSPDSTIAWYDRGFTWEWAAFTNCNTFAARPPELR